MPVSCKAKVVNSHSGCPARLTSGRSRDGLCPAFPIQTLLSTPRHDLIAPWSTLGPVPDAVSRPFACRCPADYSSHHPFQPHRWPEIMGGVEKWVWRKPFSHSVGGCWPGPLAVSPLGQMRTVCRVDFLSNQSCDPVWKTQAGDNL